MELTHKLHQCVKAYGNINLQSLIDNINDAKYINIYTDGATQYKNGQRISGIGVYFGDDDERNVSKLVNTYDNNECELLAVIEALTIVQNKNYYINIYTDSRLIVDGMTGICSKNKFNFKKLEQLVSLFIDVQFFYVKGHSGIEGNEKADALSRLQFI